MAEARTPLAALHDQFERARGEDMDAAWAFAVSWRLMRRDVEPDQVCEGLSEALALVRETQESPQDLFGEAREHADVLYEQWLSEGRLVLAAEDVRSWRQAVVTGLLGSAVLAVVFSLVLLVRDEATTAMQLRIIPVSLVIGLGASLGQAMWSRRHRRPRPLDAPADTTWSRAVTEILRSRYAMSGARVRDIVAEAHAHAAESGHSVWEEFGPPEAYAARFAPDGARRARLTAAFLAALAVLSGLPLLDGFSWTSAVLVATWTGCAVAEYRGPGRR